MLFRIRSSITPFAAGPVEARPAEAAPQQWFRRAWQWLVDELDRALERRLSMERHELARRFKKG